ncbi:MAG: hypothetical protein NXI31_13460 [bacterium]|nr:hypothetical protein [bacterium]
MQTGRFWTALATAIAAVSPSALAQAIPDQSVKHHLGIDSGYVENTNTSPAARGIPVSVWSTVVSIPGSASLRLSYSGVLLSGARDRGADGSYLKITSLVDGHHQMQHLVHVEQWRETSAYFNGDSVLVEIFAQPGTGENRLIIDSVSARTSDGEDSICFGTDLRALSSDPRAGRNQPTGCSSWLIDDCQHCFLTAGHCAGSGLQVVEFNVPLSNGNGSLNHPSPSDQYAVDTTSLQSNGGQGVGNDWAYFGVFANSNTNLTPYQANGGQSYVLTQPSTSFGTIRITGYGTVSSPVSPTWNQVQKTHAGPLFSFSGTTVRYQTDTTGGNSGSPVIVDGTNLAIGIHTHGGCNSSGGSNASTGLNHPALQTALANPQGICDCPAIEFTYPNGLPTLVNPDGSTTLRVQIGGQQPLQAGSVRFHVDIGAGFQVLTPTQVGTNLFDVNFPATSCLTNISYYLSAQDTGSNTYTDPQNAPSAVHSAISGEGTNTIRTYNFNTTPPGWNVINTSLQTGAWTRATPFDSRGPSSDYDGSGQCWVTGNANNEDVDGGPTVLRTETFNLNAANDPVIRYALWFETTGSDVMDVQVSENGGSTWTTVETLSADQGWQMHGFRVLDYATNLSQIVVRYSIADQPNNSVTEGAVDAFSIDDTTCSGATWTAFGAGCPGTNGVPSMTLASLPELGTNFALDVDNLGGGAAFMVTGLGQQILPLQQFGLGFGPTCLLVANNDVTQLLLQNAGMSTWSMSIPNDPTFAGLHLFNQVIEITAQSAVSNAGDGEIQ